MKKLLTLIFLLLFAGNGYCAQYLYKTIGIDGAKTYDYSNLETCMNANEGSLASGWFDVEIDGAWATADTTAVTIHNYTNTDATHYINIYTTSTARHSGKDDGYTINHNSYAHGISVNISYVTLDGINIKRWKISSYSNQSGIDANGTYLTIKNCLIHDPGYENVGVARGGLIFCSVSNLVVYNSILYNISGDGYGGYGIKHNNSQYPSPIVYSSVVYNCTGYGIIGYNGTYAITTKNCISYNNGTDFTNTSATSNYNFSKDDTAPGANSIHGTTDGKTPDFVSVSSGSEDFHLQSSSDAIDVGTDLGSPYDTDIDGNTRSGTWDIGADEYVSSAVATTYRRIMMFE